MGRFTPERLGHVLAAVCAAVGVDPRGARLLKFTSNAVFRLRADPVVVRIAGSTALRHRVRKVVDVAGWLADNGVPAVRLLPGVRQPVEVGDYLATVWEAVPDSGRQATTKDLATLLKQVHELPTPHIDLPSWEPLDDVRRRLGDAEELDPADRRFLEDRCERLAERLATLDYPLAPAVVHGDAHLGNLIAGPNGPVLCDFDSTCIGPPEWDLTPIPVGVHRFGSSRRAARQFARRYGFDVVRWPGFAVLREVRELKLATSVLPILRSNPHVVPELRRRLASVRTGDTSAGWSRYR
ncbi:MAG TPA: aminoglycoside phosphotransferase family protein [Pseudonocardiaceae bacterium]|nr:aminoglycoside phosphotransferase family protein [Pseudonocardiaceae bacterium]